MTRRRVGNTEEDDAAGRGRQKSLPRLTYGCDAAGGGFRTFLAVVISSWIDELKRRGNGIARGAVRFCF